MKAVNALDPVSDQIEALRNGSSPKPIVMLNLLKFRAQAQYLYRALGDKTSLMFKALHLYAEVNGEPIIKRVLQNCTSRRLFAVPAR